MKLHELKSAEGSRKNVTVLVVDHHQVMVKLQDVDKKGKKLVTLQDHIHGLKVDKLHYSKHYQNAGSQTLIVKNMRL